MSYNPDNYRYQHEFQTRLTQWKIFLSMYVENIESKLPFDASVTQEILDILDQERVTQASIIKILKIRKHTYCALQYPTIVLLSRFISVVQTLYLSTIPETFYERASSVIVTKWKPYNIEIKGN